MGRKLHSEIHLTLAIRLHTVNKHVTSWLRVLDVLDLCFGWETCCANRLTPSDPYMGRTAPLTSKRCILYIYSTNTSTEYFKHALYSPFFSLQNAVCFPYMGRTAPLTSKRCILYIYSTNIGTEYFKHALYSPFFFLFKMQIVSYC